MPLNWICATRFAHCLTCCAATSLLTLTGCSSTPSSTTGAPAAMEAAGQDGPTRTQAEIAAHLEATMLVGPAAANRLGWRPTWTSSFEADAGVQRLWANQVGVFVLDGRNELSLLDTDTGLRRWRTFIGDPGDQVLDLFVAPAANLCVVLRSDAVVTSNLDTGFPEGPLNGAVPPVQPLEWLARTGGVRTGNDIIYGGLGGEVVWQSWARGFSSKAHRVGRRVNVAPTVIGKTIVASSLNGQVVALQRGSGNLIWSRTLLDGLSGPAVHKDGLIFLSGLDQHLRCMQLDSGRPVWDALLTAPMTDAPVVIGDSVYQYVPDMGLTAWEIAPEDAPEGKQRWTSAALHGPVITALHDRLLTFDPRSAILATASPATGALDAAVQLPEGTHVQASSMVDGRLFVMSPEGRLESLVPAR